jgi:hypothetical protein
MPSRAFLTVSRDRRRLPVARTFSFRSRHNYTLGSGECKQKDFFIFPLLPLRFYGILEEGLALKGLFFVRTCA